ncbi:MAG TPA: NUDIX hydrolase [Mycobacteriales bacterium]
MTEVLSSVEQFHGHVITVRTDEVRLSSGAVVHRDVVVHPGAVGIVALDDRGRVALLEQWRQPVGQRLWELPAGLLDVPGERAQIAAARELVEEAGLVAEEWHTLVDTLSSPGMTDEATRIFLARGLRTVDRPPAEAEEADLVLRWVPLQHAVDEVLDGTLRNAMACVGVLAAARYVDGLAVPLRPPDAPWADRPTR